MRSDNGPPFTSQEIKEYMNENGIEVRRVTPLWPLANLEAESFMKALTKVIRSAHVESKTWKIYLYKFLLNYRTMPHSTTRFIPAELFFMINRNVQNKLPQIQTENTHQSDLGSVVKETQDEDINYADSKTKTKPLLSRLVIQYLLDNQKKNNLSTRFNPSPF